MSEKQFLDFPALKWLLVVTFLAGGLYASHTANSNDNGRQDQSILLIEREIVGLKVHNASKDEALNNVQADINDIKRDIKDILRAVK